MRRRSLRPPLDGADLGILVAGAAALALFVHAERRIAGPWGLPLDDSWIHLRLAANFAAGRGFGINPGEPLAASTAPLWTVALAGLLRVGVPGLAAATTLGVACFGATGLLVRRLGRAAGLRPGLAIAAGLASVGLARLVWGALSGMEVPLATALVAAGAWAAVRGRAQAAALGFGLATLARPEAGLLVVLHALAARRLATALRRLGVALLAVAPQVAFSLATLGRLVPSTVAAKTTGGVIGQAEGVRAAWAATWTALPRYLREWGLVLHADHVALIPLAAIGLVGLRGLPLGWLAAALLVHPLAAAVVAPSQGPAFQWGRYSAHLLPLVVVVALLGLQRLGGGVRAPALRAAALGLLGLALVAPLPAAADGYAWAVENINTMQVRLGRWVAEHTPPDALIAVNDIGALTYFGDRRIVDLVGLATPEILPYRRAGATALLGYLERRCPDYLVIFPAWFPDLAAREDLFRPVVRVRLANNVVAGGDIMVVYETAWHRAGTAPGARPRAARFLDTSARGC